MNTEYYIKLGHECAARGWFVWRAGMLARSPSTGPRGGVRKCRIIGEMMDGTPKTSSGDRVTAAHLYLKCEQNLVLPDLTDAATMGCLLALARQNIGRNVSTIYNQDGSWHVSGVAGCYPSEAAALMAATDQAVPNSAELAQKRLLEQAATKVRLQAEKEERAQHEKRLEELQRERHAQWLRDEPKRREEMLALQKQEEARLQAARDKKAKKTADKLAKVWDRWPAMTNDEIAKEHVNLSMALANLVEAYEKTKAETAIANRFRGKPKPKPGVQARQNHVRDANVLMVALRQELKRRGLS
jgi:hypothetical protein